MLFINGCEAEKPVTFLNVGLGQKMPSLNVFHLDGRPKSLSFESNKISILNIWATWCGPCRHEMPSLQRLSTLLDSKEYQVIGISVDTDSHIAREYLVDKKILFENFISPDMSVANDVFAIRAYPTTFIVDHQGRLQYVEEGWRFWDKPDVIKIISDIGAKSKLQQVTKNK